MDGLEPPSQPENQTASPAGVPVLHKKENMGTAVRNNH